MSGDQEPGLKTLAEGLGKAGSRLFRNYFENSSGYNHDARDIFLSYSRLVSKALLNPATTLKIYGFWLDFFKTQQEIWNHSFINGPPTGHEPIKIQQKNDKRFLAPVWNEDPYCNFVKENYLLAENLAQQIVDEVEVNDKTRKKIEFYTRQFMDALSPANFFLTNPEAVKRALETGGGSLYNGTLNLVKDIEKGRISQCEESDFEIGKNLATTPGMVIYENELIQLIHYTPAAKNVYEIPLLLVPPWINKYYILDLQPKNSLVKFLVEQGINVFIISWKNPQPGACNFTFDDYVEKGALCAIEVAKNVSGSEKVNVFGYCLGGTLVGIACSILAAKKDKVVNTATFLASMIDFSDIGPMGDVIDGALVKKLERGELLKDGVLHGHDMERAFNLIRDNDLVWNYVINNYLMGNKPPVFDVIHWTNDNTNLPGNMYIYYMRQMILENKLSRKNALRICNTPIDIGKIDFPVFVIGFKEDYISPAATCFTTTELVSGPVEFILGGSGHVMGLVHPPSKKKYHYWLNGKQGFGYEAWLKTAAFYEGSWWTAWLERLIKNSGKQKTAPAKTGNIKYKPIEPAPGSYVKEKCLV